MSWRKKDFAFCRAGRKRSIEIVHRIHIEIEVTQRSLYTHRDRSIHIERERSNFRLKNLTLWVDPKVRIYEPDKISSLTKQPSLSHRCQTSLTVCSLRMGSLCTPNSVTRFGAILKVLGKFLKLYLVFVKILFLLWHKYYAIVQMFDGCRCPNILT